MSTRMVHTLAGRVPYVDSGWTRQEWALIEATMAKCTNPGTRGQHKAHKPRPESATDKLTWRQELAVPCPSCGALATHRCPGRRKSHPARKRAAVKHLQQRKANTPAKRNAKAVKVSVQRDLARQREVQDLRSEQLQLKLEAAQRREQRSR